MADLQVTTISGVDTVACLREFALHPKPVYLVAARDAAERVGPI
jgi:hypothetical protein